VYPEAGDNEEALIQNADIAMYHVKGNRKNSYQFFSEEMSHQFSTRLTMERELRNAITRGEFVIHYQPQIELPTGRIVGVESLVRWDHPEQGLIEPLQFLPLASETGLIVQVDEFVQRQAFKDVARWRAQGHPQLSLSVNVSPIQLEQDSFVQRFLAGIAEAGLEPAAVKVEITETTLMRDTEAIVPRLRELRKAGIGIAIDDFGTGYSSLSHLQQFPINALKVDRSFVADIRAEQSGASIIDAIVAMARGLKLDLVAEGVENRTQLRYLHAQGCREVQGYIFSAPVPESTVATLLATDPYRGSVLEDREDGDPL
jgi:diguanylate cyclase